MKNWTWKQWTALGIVAAAVITGAVLHFVQPTVSYALTEAIGAGLFVLGGTTVYLYMRKTKETNN